MLNDRVALEIIKLRVARNLKKYREKNGMTQKELAEELTKRLGKEFKHNTVSSWESGTNSIDISVLFEICNLFGVPVDAMYRESDLPPTIAAHLPEGVELTEEEQAQLNDYIQFLLSRRKNK